MTHEMIETAARDVLRRYPVRRAALFGSAARDAMTEQSDIDILIEFLPGRGGVGFEFFGLQGDLEEALNRRVDLITFHSLARAKPAFRETVEKDARLIYER